MIEFAEENPNRFFHISTLNCLFVKHYSRIVLLELTDDNCQIMPRY
jgi:hypothetical protein